jgi:hypothetical protein
LPGQTIAGKTAEGEAGLITSVVKNWVESGLRRARQTEGKTRHTEPAVQGSGKSKIAIDNTFLIVYYSLSEVQLFLGCFNHAGFALYHVL